MFSLEFSALSYLNPATNRYRYKLEGLDSKWHEVGSEQRLVNYTTLPVGIYVFRVQGATSQGPWSEPGVELRLEILPPWWRTWWFCALCTAAFLGLLWVLYQIRVQQVRRQEKMLRDVIETIPTFAWTALPDGSVDFVNRHWQEYTGLSTDRTVGSGWEAAVHTADLKRHAEKWRTLSQPTNSSKMRCAIGGLRMDNTVRSWLAPCRCGINEARSLSGTVSRPTSKIASVLKKSGETTGRPRACEPSQHARRAGCLCLSRAEATHRGSHDKREDLLALA